MATNTQIKNNIDLHITNKTVPGSIDNEEVGIDIKSIVDYVDQEITTLNSDLQEIINNETQNLNNELSAQSSQIDSLANNVNELQTNFLYKKYIALLSQTSTNNPVATVFENTMDDIIVWTRDSVGTYTGTLTGAFVNFKTWFSITPINYAGLYEVFSLDENTIRIRTADITTLTLVDGQLNETPLEIRVYN